MTTIKTFTVKNSMPKNILAAFQTITKSRHALAVCDYIMIQVEPGNVSFAASDLETFATWDELRHDNTGDTFSFLVDPAILTRLTTVQDLEYNPESQTVKVDGFTFGTIPAEDFPMVPEIPTTRSHSMKATTLQHLSQFTTKDQMRPAMTGINIGPELCASDGHRLIKAPGIECTPFVLPCVKILSKLKGDIIIQEPQGTSYARIYAERCSFMIRTINQKYPDFNAVIPDPANAKYFVSMDSETLYNAIVKILPAANKTTSQIFFDILENTVKLTAKDVDTGNSAQTEIDRHTNRQYTRIAFNGKLFVSMLKGQKGNFTLQFNGETKPFVWRSGEYLNLIMPVIAYNEEGEMEGPTLDIIMPAAYHTAITEGTHAGLTETDTEEIQRKTAGLTLIRWEETHSNPRTGAKNNIYTFHNPKYTA